MDLRSLLIARDAAVFMLGMGLILVHIIGEMLLGGEDQPRQGIVLTAVTIGLVVLYCRLGPRARAGTAVALGAVGLASVVGMHLVEGLHHGTDLSVYLAGFAVVGNVILLVLGGVLTAERRPGGA